ncbi:MAG: Trk family potassium uptake protein [Clostridia bacterium]|nr:Trk family potassium uptake protein [Clostridia bacterium]
MVRKRKLNPAAQIVIGFLAIILIGTFLLCLPISSNNGQWFSFIDSLLTSTSSVCVTGLIAVDTAVHFSLFGQIVIILLIQCGGLGFITLTSLVFLIMGKKITYEKRITMQESFNQENVQGIVKLVKNVIILVFAVEFIGFLCLAPSLVNMYGWSSGLFKALFLAISAFCNAGFDVLGTTSTQFANLNVVAQNALILLPIMLLIVIGGLGYVVLFDIGKKFKHKKLTLHSKVVLIMTSILIFGGAFLFAVLEWNNPNTIGNMSFWDKIVNSFFCSITPRTAGFTSVNLAAMQPASIVLMDVLMFIGGSPASAAGGIKTTTLLILLIAIFKGENSNGNIPFCKKKISTKMVKKSLRVIVLALLLVVISTFLLCAFEGGNITATEAIFESISAISTVGLTLGITPTLTIASKLILVFLMFTGRVGALTLTLALANRKKNVSYDIEYPDSKIMIG